MRLSQYRETYYEFSGKASDVARSLAFAGIALVWIFRSESVAGPRPESATLLPGAMFAVALAFDLLQYVSATVVWGLFQWFQERRLGSIASDPDLTTPSWLKWPQFSFFVLKLFVVILGYVFLTLFLWRAWWVASN